MRGTRTLEVIDVAELLARSIAPAAEDDEPATG
jgi:hypothetical protein